MFRSRWGKILTVIGGLITALASLSVAYQLYDSSEQEHAVYRYQPAEKSRRVIFAPAKLPAAGYQPNCENPNQREDADLCAQWAAVQQVAESNRLTSVNLRLGIFTLILSMLGTWLLVWTLAETRATSRRELRAYLFPERVGIFHVLDGTKLTRFIGSRIHIKNSGQTPAYNVRHWNEIRIEEFSKESSLAIDTSLGAFSNPVPPNGEFHKRRDTTKKLTREQIRGLKNGTLVIYVYGRILYEDTFGVERLTEYRFAWSGWRIPQDVSMNFAREGNYAN